MPEAMFLVERYLPQLCEADLIQLGRSLSAASDELARDGRPIRWLGSLALVDDETCLCLFCAASIADVQEANRRADASYEHIVQTVVVAPSPLSSSLSARASISPTRPPIQPAPE
jgi:hypothetical protein